MTGAKSLPPWARDSVVLALAEVAIVAGLFVADVYHHIFFSKTPYLFFLAWASLRLRGMRWKEVGFERPRSWGRAFGVGIAVGLAMEVLELFVTQPLLIGICRLEKSGGSSLLTEPSPIRPILPLQIIIRHSHIRHPHVRAVVLDLFSGVQCDHAEQHRFRQPRSILERT